MKPKHEVCCAFSELQVKEIWELEQSFACFLFLFLKRMIQGIALAFTGKVWKLAQVVDSIFRKQLSYFCFMYCFL